MAVIDRDGQDVMIAADGCIGIAQNLAQFRIAQQVLDAILHLVVDRRNLLPHLCQIWTRHVEHMAARVDTASDGFGDQPEIFDRSH